MKDTEKENLLFEITQKPENYIAKHLSSNRTYINEKLIEILPDSKSDIIYNCVIQQRIFPKVTAKEILYSTNSIESKPCINQFSFIGGIISDATDKLLYNQTFNSLCTLREVLKEDKYAISGDDILDLPVLVENQNIDS